MSDDARVEIEQDGARFRWVLCLGDHRIAKGSRWWASEDEAGADYDEFAKGVANAPVRKP